MEAILNVFWGIIEALPPVLSASVLMLGVSAFAAAILCFLVAAIALRKEKSAE